MPNLAWFPALDMGAALAFNSYMGMNTTLGYLANRGTNMYASVFCQLMDKVMAFKVPGFPKLNCGASKR